jgi:hypothetical protein
MGFYPKFDFFNEFEYGPQIFSMAVLSFISCEEFAPERVARMRAAFRALGAELRTLRPQQAESREAVYLANYLSKDTSYTPPRASYLFYQLLLCLPLDSANAPLVEVFVEGQREEPWEETQRCMGNKVVAAIVGASDAETLEIYQRLRLYFQTNGPKYVKVHTASQLQKNNCAALLTMNLRLDPKTNQRAFCDTLLKALRRIEDGV